MAHERFISLLAEHSKYQWQCNVVSRGGQTGETREEELTF